MKIDSVRLFQYSLPLAEPLKLKRHLIEKREGFLVELIDSSGNKSYGEAAPLPGFSRQDPAFAGSELSQMKKLLAGKELPDGLEKLDGGFERFFSSLTLSPSVRFGIETAILSLTSQAGSVSLSQLLGAQSVDSIRINALLTGTGEEIQARASASEQEGFTSFKLKLSGLSVDDAVDIVRAVRGKIGDADLRGDANRFFALGDAIRLMQGIESFNVEYVEEPAQNLNQLRKLLGEKKAGTGIALDESLLEIRPEDLSVPYAIKAIVIKPTLLGFERAYRFAVEAKRNGITPVISSSFETSVGISALASLAAVAGGSDVAAGLDTLGWFKQDLASNPIKITNGRILLSDCDPESVKLNTSLLEEIAGD